MTDTNTIYINTYFGTMCREYIFALRAGRRLWHWQAAGMDHQSSACGIVGGNVLRVARPHVYKGSPNGVLMMISILIKWLAT